MNKNARNLQPLNQISSEGNSPNQTKVNHAKTFSSSMTEMSHKDTHPRKSKKKPIDFYAMFTKAIQHNEDQLINQRKCIEEITKAKIEEEAKRKPKIRRKSNIEIAIEKQKKRKQSQLEIQIQKAKNDKVLGVLGFNSNDPERSLCNDDEHTSDHKFEDKANKDDDEGNKMKEFLKKKVKEKRRKVLQSALIFLESNSITISEFIKRNPFQDKPFELKYSFEFIEAVKFGEYELVKSALQMNHHFLFSYDYFRQTAYHWAAKLGNHKLLGLLILNGKYCNQYDHQNRTPLYLAALNNHYECCQLLLSNYANPFLCDINKKKPVDVLTDNEIYVLITNYMDTPYSNPVMRKKMGNVVKIFELKKNPNSKDTP